MKIVTPKNELRYDQATMEQLETFIAQPEPTVSPPCSGCEWHDQENCSTKCERAPRALSIDPDRYPIEPKVAGLVYEMAASRLLQTCFSCEGHMINNKLWKLPQVSFYSDSTIYVKLLMIYLDRIFHKKVLSYRWHIVLADLTPTLNLTYNIQPDLNQEESPHLGRLQQDLVTLADDMHGALKEIARELLLQDRSGRAKN